MPPFRVRVRGAARLRAWASASPAGGRCRRTGSRSPSRTPGRSRCPPPLAEHGAALVLVRPPPDAVGLAGVQRVGETVPPGPAPGADGLGLRFALLAGSHEPCVRSQGQAPGLALACPG